MWLFQVCWKMSYLPKLIFTTDGTIRGTWCQDVRHQIGDVSGPHTYQLLMWQETLCGPLYTASSLVLWALCNGLGDMGESLFAMEVMGVSKPSSHMWGSQYLPMFLLWNGSLTLMIMASLMVLAMESDSYLLWRNCPPCCDDLSCWHSYRWGKVPLVPLTFPQRSMQTPLCISHQTSTFCTCICILPHFSM